MARESRSAGSGSPLLHRAPVSYPAAALEKGIEGTVVVQMKLDANGEVSDATVLSGPDELRKGVLQSVLTWHFEKSTALTTRTANIDFAKPATANSAVPQVPVANGQLQRQLPNAVFSARIPPPPPPPPGSGKLDHIAVTGLSDSARSDLLASLPIREGGDWTDHTLADVKAAVNQFDSHLTTALVQSSGGEITLRIALGNTVTGGPGTVTFTANTATTGGRGGAGAIPPGLNVPGLQGVFSVGNGTLPPTVISKVDPQYSPEALTAKYSSSVMLSVVISTEGKAEDVKVVKSLGMGLDEKAIEAVLQWRVQETRHK